MVVIAIIAQLLSFAGRALASTALPLVVQPSIPILFGQITRQQRDAAPASRARETPGLCQRLPDREAQRRPNQTIKLAPRLIKGTDGALSIAISPDGRTLASGDTSHSALGEARLWDLENCKVLASLPGHRGPVIALAFSPDGKMLAAAAEPEKLGMIAEVRLWGVAGREVRHTLSEGSRRLAAVAFSPDGRILATGGEDGAVRLWDVTTGRQQERILANRGWVRSVAFSPDGKWLATGGSGGPFNLRLRDVSGGRGRSKLVPNEFWISSIAFSCDGRTLAVAGVRGTERAMEANGEVKLYDLIRDREIASLGLGQPGDDGAILIGSVAFSPDGEYLAAVGAARLRMWRTGIWQEVGTFNSEFANRLKSVVISNDGRRMAVSTWDDQPVMLWNMADWRPAP
jgi:WD40 repeat protein